MKYLLAIVAIAALSTGPVVAAEATAAAVTCATGPASTFKPQADLEAMLTKTGLTIKQIKIEGGCYEVYAVDKDGKKVNAAYNAETLEQVANAEAGEN